ncbi:MAG: FKBP-type peptidyl-prolyl cis-trans isomerase [Lachnospiraceae bacterium]|nr:FKBP-type peptidyl-prolyl cis-trans isomerase [Lachnospiraceae bacterium]
MKKLFKNTIMIALIGAMSLAVLSGCGKKEAAGENNSSVAKVPDEEATYVSQLDIEKYVEVPGYNEMEVTVAGAYEVTDEEVDYYLSQQVSQLAVGVDSEKLVTDRAVENGDVINLDYAGYKDGVAFDGGTATNQALWIGSGSFIAGFEEGLVGVNPGETVDLNLTFPENYGNADLAGAEVVFTCTVNGIIPEDDIVDLFNVSNGNGDGTVKGFDGIEEYIRNYISESANQQYQSELENAIAEKIMEIAVFKDEFPAAIILKYQKDAEDLLNQYAEMYQTDAETMATQYMGVSADAFIKDNSYQQLKIDSALAYIAVKENIGYTEEELAAKLDEYITESGYAITDEEKAALNPEDFRDSFIAGDVMEYLKGVVKVNN